MFDDKKALNILKTQLIFLRLRGYSPRCALPELFFEDSPSCIKRNCPTRTCSDCPLIQFVPPERRSEKAACRHIALDETGMTLDRLYQCGNRQETEEAVETWLHATIDRLEEKHPNMLPLNALGLGTSINELAKT